MRVSAVSERVADASALSRLFFFSFFCNDFFFAHTSRRIKKERRKKENPTMSKQAHKRAKPDAEVNNEGHKSDAEVNKESQAAFEWFYSKLSAEPVDPAPIPDASAPFELDEAKIREYQHRFGEAAANRSGNVLALASEVWKEIFTDVVMHKARGTRGHALLTYIKLAGPSFSLADNYKWINIDAFREARELYMRCYPWRKHSPWNTLPDEYQIIYTTHKRALVTKPLSDVTAFEGVEVHDQCNTLKIGKADYERGDQAETHAALSRLIVVEPDVVVGRVVIYDEWEKKVRADFSSIHHDDDVVIEDDN
jgi:hypothetical protein